MIIFGAGVDVRIFALILEVLHDIKLFSHVFCAYFFTRP